jgi:hypothetical protein
LRQLTAREQSRYSARVEFEIALYRNQAVLNWSGCGNV